jgi:threonine/homoserine/homoserine lactone efflux protein
MNLHTWWLFVGMTFVVSATPGPNMLLVMSSSARFGVRAAMATMVGCMTALMAMMCISAAGMGALLQAFPNVFDALRLAGAAYLAYLGVLCWRAPVHEAQADVEVVPPASQSAWALYRRGAMVAASNPKAMLFAAAFFPQFIHAGSAPLPQFAILLATFTVIEVSWYFVYAFSGHKLSQHLQRPNVMRMFNRVTGGVFIGFAGLMAAVRD